MKGQNNSKSKPKRTRMIPERKAHNFDDKTGRRYSNLLILGLYGYDIYPNGKKRTVWRCKCDCGKIILREGGMLSSGQKSKSCGCTLTRGICSFKEEPRFARINKKTDRKYLLSGLSQIYRSYIQGADKRNIPFKLNIDDFLAISQENCYYCGRSPSTFREARYMKNKEGFYFNGIDRKNSKLGYNTKNCVSCCDKCNYAKRETDYTDFIKMVKQIYSKHFS